MKTINRLLVILGVISLLAGLWPAVVSSAGLGNSPVRGQTDITDHADIPIDAGLPSNAASMVVENLADMPFFEPVNTLFNPVENKLVSSNAINPAVSDPFIPPFSAVPGLLYGTGFSMALTEAGGSISGHVYQTNGIDPLVGANVGSFSYSSSSGKWEPSGGTVTGNNGDYLITGLTTGSYRVMASSTGYANQWFGGVFDYRYAVSVSVTAPDITPNINFTLQPGGTISGLVTSQSSGLPLPNVTLDLFLPDNSWVEGAITGANGIYTFNGLPYGQYKISSPSGGRWGSGDDGFVVKYFNNKSDMGSADMVTVSAQFPNISGINFSLVQGGSISGHVYQTDGSSPVAGAGVKVFEYGSLTGKWVMLIGANTGSDGGYTISGIPTGVYGVLVGAQGYANQWYGGVYNSRNAASVSVIAPNTTSGINFILQPGGSISGTVSSQSTGLPLANISLDLWHADGSGAGGATTDANGNYSFNGLPYGQYKVGSPAGGRWGSGDDGYMVNIYHNKTDINSADLVTVSAQSPVITGINFSLAMGGYVSGHIYQPNGTTPVVGAQVGLFDYSSLTGKWLSLIGTNTGSDGGYVLAGILSGVYGVAVSAPGYANQWYTGVYDSRNASPVSVTAPGVTSNINFILQPGGSISGTVSSHSTGLALANISVDLWHADNSGAGGAITDANGNYSFSGLPYGQYKLGSPSGGRWGSGDNGYVIKIYNNKTNVNNADLVAVSAQSPDTTGINFSLVQGGSISGSVTNTTGQPIANLHIFATEYASNVWTAGTFTNSEGVYHLIGLSAGSYRVRAWPPNNGLPYVDELFNNTHDYNAATPVVVSAAGDTAGINFVLEAAGFISGTVTVGGIPLANIQVNATLASSGQFIAGLRTDTNGNYTLNLPAGSYLVQARPTDTQQTYVNEYYSNAYNSSQATPVSVTLGNTTGNINFMLDRGGNISGHVYESNGSTPIQGAAVTLRDFSTRQYITGTSTGSDGSYTLYGVPHGQYNVLGWAPGHVRKWYPNTTQSGLAQALTVTDANYTFTGINFTLESGGTISGTLSSGASNPANISVWAQGINGTVGDGMAITAVTGNGSYTITGLPFGSYRVCAPSGLGVGSADSAYLQTYFNNKGQAEADPVVISVGTPDAADINFNLVEAPGAAITGFVYDRSTNMPISAATVLIRTFNPPVQPIASVTTGQDGSYQASGLANGDYLVVAVASGHAARMWKDVLYRPQASAVTVSGTLGAANINFRLEAGGPISGKVTSQTDGSAMSNISIKVVSVSDPANFWVAFSSNNTGEFTLNVPNGSYKVCAPSGVSGPSGPVGTSDPVYGQEYYNNKSDYIQADTVVVINPSGASAIDFSLRSKYGGILRIIKNILPDVLGYQPEMDRLDLETQGLWAEPLVAIDENSQAVPMLATSWEVDLLNNSLTVHLRQGVKFHDGTDFNAPAARWNFDKMINAHKIANWQSITSVNVVDTYTLRLFVSDMPYTLLVSALTSVYMYSPSACENNGIEWARLNPVATGPFKLVSYSANDTLVLTKNIYYWQAGYPYLDGIRLQCVPDPLTQKLVMEAKLADVWPGITSPATALAMESEGYKVNYSRPYMGWYLYPDTRTDSPLNNIKVRQAIAKAIDNAYLAQALGLGKYEPMNQLVISDCEGYNPDYSTYLYNPLKAKQLLYEAGYPNGFKIDLEVNSIDLDVANIIKQYLEAVGIDCVIDANDTAAYFSKFYSSGWEGLLLGVNPVSSSKRTVGEFAQSLGPNRNFPITMLRPWPQTVLDLMNQGLHIYDDAARAPVARQMIKLASDQLNLIPLYGRPFMDVQQVWVRDWLSPKAGVGNFMIYQVWLEQINQVVNDAPLYLDPANVSAAVGQTFDMQIRTNVNSSQPVDGVDAYIMFDASKLQVVDSDSGQAGIQITPGASLNKILINSVDNTGGLISFCAGQLEAAPSSGNFTVATIRFQAKGVTSPDTQVAILISGMNTVSTVDFAGAPIPGAHGDASVQIISGANVNISVVLQGGSRPDGGWAVPLTVKFFTPGILTPANVLTATPLSIYNITTTKLNQTAIAQAAGVVPGTYDISVVTSHSLINVKRGVVISAPSTDVNLGTLLEGNANDNEKININDFGILAATYGKSLGNAGYDARADFDRNNKINITDFGLLAANYNKNSPVEAP